MSIHNEAKKGDIAEFILLVGDPFRAKYIAENYLEDIFCYNQIRGMLGYTGTYQGKKISVQGVGMGMPSMTIYATELILEYEVETLVRIGSCGSIQEETNLGDVILATSASTDSAMNKIRFGGADFAPAPNFQLLEKAWKISNEKSKKVHVGSVLTSDFFYNETSSENPFLNWIEYGTLAVEMETAALYSVAAKYGKRALSILTVSDHIIKHQAMPPLTRQNSLDDMIELALQVAVN
ncbi:purine-nucleoside phosphorylase [Maribacter sp. 2304DJ31-5]|uniref:purine-nucleoside phosphorylase n=1 Tax=Maribacter sp. 2304DJ31-5 TaxID=3386273 RepID=UPI0039BCAEEF